MYMPNFKTLYVLQYHRKDRGVTVEYPATLTALLKNCGYSVRSVGGNHWKCSKAVLAASYVIRGTQWKFKSRLKAILRAGDAVLGELKERSYIHIY